tara:strand:+ start:2135 stop:2482 length:348 start_codon:yes stop_codon:yes gene_type:complete
MNFEDKIKTWVSIDNKIKEHNDELKTLRQKRETITTEVYGTVKENNLDNATIEISDGKLKFQSVKVTQPLSIKFVKECLEDIISDEDKVKQILDHIKEKRNEKCKYVDNIKRYYV